MNEKQLILDFMATHDLMTIATLSSNGLPQSAVTGFAQTEELELIFGTSKNSRKAKNIPINPSVAVVIGWDGSGTVQYEGDAVLLDGKDKDKYSAIYIEKHPDAKKYRDDPEEVYFMIKPRWIRLTEVAKSPWAIHEIKF